jgi:hypothetical protein
MIWSIIPESVIFAQEADSISLKIIDYQGRKMVVRDQNQGQYEVISLMSTDPADYMNKGFAPGSLINRP